MSNLLKKVVTGISSVALVAAMVLVPAASANAASPGEVYKTPDGTVWFITSDMQKRPFTSAGAFLSYGFLSFSQVKDADASVTSLPTGSFIAPQDGRIFCATMTKGSDVAGECSLITGGQKAAFTSSNVFSGQGYSFSRAYYGDSSFLSKTSNIDMSSAQHRPGTLINNGGTVQLVVNGGLWGVPSLDVFNSWGWSFADVVPSNAADVTLAQIGIIPGRTAGYLVPTGTTGNNQNPTPTPTGATPTPTPADCSNLSGSAGSIIVDSNSEYSSEEVGEGERDVPVLAFDVEADSDSDVSVTSVKVELSNPVVDAGSTNKLDKVAKNVSVWYDGKKVGTATVSSFSESGNIYTKTISLDCSVVMGDETGMFSVAITGNDVIDSANLSDTWNADVLNVRFMDADGVTVTEDTDADALDQTFTFEDFATSTNVELQVNLNEDDSDINESHIVDIDDNDTTRNVSILSFTLENKGNSDINVEEIPVNLDVVGVTNVDDFISKISLWMDGSQIGTETVGSGVGADETYVFDNLDIDINGGDTMEFMVKVDVKPTSGALDDGDTISAQLSATEVDAIDATDESNNDLSAANLTGTAVGEAIAVYDNGIMVDFVSATETVTSPGDPATALSTDKGTFKITFTARAFGDNDQRIDRSCEEDDVDNDSGADVEDGFGDAGEGVVYHVSDDSAGILSCVLTSSTTDSEDNSNVFELDRGVTRTFTLSVVVAGDDDFVQIALESINWGTATDDTNANYYTFNLDEYKTDPLFLNVY